MTLHRAGISPVVAAISLIPLTLVYTGCRGRNVDTSGSTPALYGVPNYHFEYCELKPTEQKVDTSGGLGSLAAVMGYWDVETNEETLAEKYPPPANGGHSIRKLRRIAIDEGLTAFALVMKENGLDQIGEQLENGRPVIVALHLPEGGYSGLRAETEGLERERFAVVFGQSETEFLVMDAGTGVIRIPKSDFESVWSAGKYAALICSSS